MLAARLLRGILLYSWNELAMNAVIKHMYMLEHVPWRRLFENVLHLAMCAAAVLPAMFFLYAARIVCASLIRPTNHFNWKIYNSVITHIGTHTHTHNRIHNSHFEPTTSLYRRFFVSSRAFVSAFAMLPGRPYFGASIRWCISGNYNELTNIPHIIASYGFSAAPHTSIIGGLPIYVRMTLIVRAIHGFFPARFTSVSMEILRPILARKWAKAITFWRKKGIWDETEGDESEMEK